MASKKHPAALSDVWKHSRSQALDEKGSSALLALSCFESSQPFCHLSDILCNWYIAIDALSPYFLSNIIFHLSYCALSLPAPDFHHGGPSSFFGLYHFSLYSICIGSSHDEGIGSCLDRQPSAYSNHAECTGSCLDRQPSAYS